MADKTLDNLFEDTLRDIYYAERKILPALRKMAKGAQAAELKAAFQKHEAETEIHVERLVAVFEKIGKRARGKTCPAIDGIIEEGEEILEDYKGTSALDAGLLAAAQAVEHYEISRYGTLVSWATEMGETEVAAILQRTLDEEGATDKALTQLAKSAVNLAAEKKAA